MRFDLPGGLRGERRQDNSMAADGGSNSSQARRHASDEGEDEHGAYFGPGPDLEDQFTGMKLHGKEEEDLDLSAEVEELIKDVRWLALFRVHTTKPFSHAALLQQMRNACVAT